MRLPKASFLPFWIYVSLSLVVTVYVLIIGNFGPQHYELAALPILLLAMPWCLVLPNFKPRLIASSEYNNSVLIMLIFVVLNAVILCVMGLAADALLRCAPPEVRREGSAIGK